MTPGADSSLPVLEYLEIEITEFCNLNCRGCCDFSNLASEKNIYEFEEFSRDMDRLRELFSGIRKLRLMGGEPFLNKDVVKYAEKCREVFPDTDLRLVTNGLLIPTLPEEIPAGLKKCGVHIEISNYPATRKRMKDIKPVLEKAQLSYKLGLPTDFFFRTIRKAPAQSPVPAFNNCIFSYCHMMGHGKIAPCSYAYCIPRFNREYGFDYPENDIFDLYGNITGDELIEAFSRPHSFCRYCGMGLQPMRWRCGVTADKAKPDDWIIHEGVFSRYCAPVIQKLLKPMEEELRTLTQKRTDKQKTEPQR